MAKRHGNGEGGIYQRESDGIWCASVDLGFMNGKRRRKVIYGKTCKEVADKEHATTEADVTAWRTANLRGTVIRVVCAIERLTFHSLESQ